jgi:hypothetical protein
VLLSGGLPIDSRTVVEAVQSVRREGVTA